jgi:hypothetical protein
VRMVHLLMTPCRTNGSLRTNSSAASRVVTASAAHFVADFDREGVGQASLVAGEGKERA